MKLLLDQNLSRRLIRAIQTAFPGSAHVAQFGLESAKDMEVWTYAAANGFTIVSKDSDFRDLAHSRGYPPKVVHLDVGNCSSGEILRILAAIRPNWFSFRPVRTVCWSSSATERLRFNDPLAVRVSWCLAPRCQEI